MDGVLFGLQLGGAELAADGDAFAERGRRAREQRFRSVLAVEGDFVEVQRALLGNTFRGWFVATQHAEPGRLWQSVIWLKSSRPPAL